jgi:thiamine biosynthesis lipoprotein
MGTTYTVKVVTQGPPGSSPTPAEEEVQRTIEERLAEVDEKMSTYRPSSELSRFNSSRATEPFPVSAETLEVFAEAQRVSAATGGAFDITVGPLVNLWGFGPAAKPATIPPDEEIERLKPQIGWGKIEVDTARSTIRKWEPEMYCDLSAIAKGYAVDRVAEGLSALGFADYMVEVGGEVRTRGRNAAREPWRIAIERPDTTRRAFQEIVPLSDLAMATSGDYRNFYEQDGVRFSHTIDPRTGRPIQHRLASVSVVDPLCMRADGYATALMVLGENEGFELAKDQGLAALFLVRTGDQFDEKATPAFKTLFPDVRLGGEQVH